MKKTASLLVVLGSGLAAFGLSGFNASLRYDILPGLPSSYSGEAGWSFANQLEITAGVVLVACGGILRSDSNPH